MPTDKTPLAAFAADAELIKTFAAEDAILRKRPDRMAQLTPILIESLEIALRAHRRGGCTPGQLQRLCALTGEAEEISK